MKNFLSIFSLILISSPGFLFGQANATDTLADLEKYREVNDFVDENEGCFKCHAETKYVLVDEFFGREITNSMCPDKIIERDEYYSMV
ncbi:MAG: hypothetical protein K9G38_05515, partial [Bacteroidales bacterium]|nr:hypothetical protein [Bacteroidales bacterium]